MHRTLVAVALAGALTMAMPLASTQAPTFAERLEAVRARATLPAVAGAHFSSAGVGEIEYACGGNWFTRAGSPEVLKS